MNRLRRVIDAIKNVSNHYGGALATEAAGILLRDKVLTISDYLYLVRWSEGRDARNTVEWLYDLPVSCCCTLHPGNGCCPTHRGGAA